MPKLVRRSRVLNEAPKKKQAIANIEQEQTPNTPLEDPAASGQDAGLNQAPDEAEVGTDAGDMGAEVDPEMGTGDMGGDMSMTDPMDPDGDGSIEGEDEEVDDFLNDKIINNNRKYRLMGEYRKLYDVNDKFLTTLKDAHITDIDKKVRKLILEYREDLKEIQEKLDFMMLNDFQKRRYQELFAGFAYLKAHSMSVVEIIEKLLKIK